MQETKIDMIIARLDRIEETQAVIDKRVYEIHGETSALKVRASIFGFFSGLIAAILTVVSGKGHSG